jgi:Fe-S-cluster containining protein
MSGEDLVFECRRCGTCCRDLLQEDKGVLRGLTLLPGEEEAFTGTSVRPAIGQGRRPHERGFTIIARQLSQETCPHLGDTDCRIYSERPASCRQFPFSLREGPDGRQQLGLDLSCPSLAELVDGLSNLRIKFEDRLHAERLLEVERIAVERPNRSWYFDLGSGKWIRLDRLIEES